MPLSSARPARDGAQTTMALGAGRLFGLSAYADGTVRRRTGGGMSARFYYDGDQEILETEGTSPIASAAVRRRYIRLPGSVDEPLLMIDYTADASCASGAAAAPGNYGPCERWAHADRLGSAVMVTDSAGAVVEKFRYGPYGELGSGTASGFPFRYTGQKLDPVTGLYHYKARWYDPETGRFLQTDPIGYEDQMNLYAYVGNDPINQLDPNGEWAVKIGINLGAAFGGAVGASGGFYFGTREDGSFKAGFYKSASVGVGAGGDVSVGASVCPGCSVSDLGGRSVTASGKRLLGAEVSSS